MKRKNIVLGLVALMSSGLLRAEVIWSTSVQARVDSIDATLYEYTYVDGVSSVVATPWENAFSFGEGTEFTATYSFNYNPFDEYYTELVFDFGAGHVIKSDPAYTGGGTTIAVENDIDGIDRLTIEGKSSFSMIQRWSLELIAEDSTGQVFSSDAMPYTFDFADFDSFSMKYHFEYDDRSGESSFTASAVPAPGGGWLFSSALLCLCGMLKRKINR